MLSPSVIVCTPMCLTLSTRPSLLFFFSVNEQLLSIITAAVKEGVKEGMKEARYKYRSIPSTLPETPVEDNNSAFPSPPTSVVCTVWNIYSKSTPLTAKDYYTKLYHHFNAVNGTYRFRIDLTRNHFIVRDGNKIVFKCEPSLLYIRNVYLELHACNYICEHWLANRTELDLNYGGLITPLVSREPPRTISSGEENGNN